MNPQDWFPLVAEKSAQPFRVFGHTRINARDLSEPPATGRPRTPLGRRSNYACATYLSKILYVLNYLNAAALSPSGNTQPRRRCDKTPPLALIKPMTLLQNSVILLRE
jgi:hypothetical protein